MRDKFVPGSPVGFERVPGTARRYRALYSQFSVVNGREISVSQGEEVSYHKYIQLSHGYESSAQRGQARSTYVTRSTDETSKLYPQTLRLLDAWAHKHKTTPEQALTSRAFRRDLANLIEYSKQKDEGNEFMRSPSGPLAKTLVSFGYRRVTDVQLVGDSEPGHSLAI